MSDASVETCTGRTRSIPIHKLTGHEGAKPGPALVRSITEQGYLAEFPVVVAPLPEGRYRILDGRRRTAAAEKAGLKSLPAVVSEASIDGVEGAGAALTILAHATRSENPVAELKAYRELMRSGMSEEQIARAGFASLQWVRKIAKLNRLIPEMAERVEAGEIAPGVAFEVAALAPEVQAELAREEQITGPVVKEYRSARRRESLLGAPDLAGVFEIQPPATIEVLFEALSAETLEAILGELPHEERFTIWRGKIRRALSLSETAFLPAEISMEQVR